MKTVQGVDMARIRTIKPTFWTDEDMADISEAACLLAIGLLNYADDEGYFNANPKLIKAAVFPIRETSGSIPVLLQELSNCGYISLFSTQDGKRYGLINNFTKHQVVNKKTPSKIKELNLLPENYGSDTGGLPLGKEGKGNIKPLSNTREDNFQSDLNANNSILNGRVPGGGFGVNDKFVMYHEWQPDPDFVQKAAYWGAILKSPMQPHELAEFVTFWKSEGKAKTHEQWEMALAKSIKYQRSKNGEVKNGTSNRVSSQKEFSGHSRSMQEFYRSVREEYGDEAIAAMEEADRALWGQVDQQERSETVIDVEASAKRIE
ncbi:DnaT-like ssDNA-binding domain-containing protein [Providencia zhijiangensis]|uniref:DnaT-like ssDNA-binding domain-containing protein n=1 Tax=Providencia zhijiangensis TaxID=3053982 RepID=A0ABZ0MXB5_9GAMM|nr:DnaT-like ssDNA-binding domain-containing protein [Providencia sp. D4759]WPA90708.1 DnaT-like ssDNA-binding domain-containing protein [Providencia sp. D4759]